MTLSKLVCRSRGLDVTTLLKDLAVLVWDERLRRSKSWRKEAWAGKATSCVVLKPAARFPSLDQLPSSCDKATRQGGHFVKRPVMRLCANRGTSSTDDVAHSLCLKPSDDALIRRKSTFGACKPRFKQ
jgi:hypothetical protein